MCRNLTPRTDQLCSWLVEPLVGKLPCFSTEILIDTTYITHLNSWAALPGDNQPAFEHDDKLKGFEEAGAALKGPEEAGATHEGLEEGGAALEGFEGAGVK